MENDVLKNKIAPWQEKGRWYHGVVDIATHAFISNLTDEYLRNNFAITNVSTTWQLRSNQNIKTNIIDLKRRNIDVVYSSSSTVIPTIYYYSDGRPETWYLYPSTATSGKIEIWVFMDK